MAIAHLDCAVNPIPTEVYPTKAIRAKYSLLSTEKISQDFGVFPRNWLVVLKEGIDQMLRQEL